MLTKSGKKIDITRAKEIAAGGEGRIIEHPGNSRKVIKVYHTPRSASFEKHLSILASLGPEFVKPQDIYFDNAGHVVGYDMAYVDFNDYWLFNNLFNKGFCTSNHIDNPFKIRVLQKLREAVEDIHSKNIVIGDLNQYNIFFSKTGDILFVDTDSYASNAFPHSGILLEDIRDATTNQINKETDSWAYDVLSFWATTFCHPFKWVVPGNKLSIGERIIAHESYLSKIPGMKIPPLYQPPIGELHTQFSEIFSGRRYMVSFDGHLAVGAQIKQPVASADVSIRELYSGVFDVNACQDSIAIKTGATKWLLVETAIHGVTRQLTEHDCDMLYPGDYRSNSYKIAWVTRNTLTCSTGFAKTFNKPVFYFNNGSLSVFDLNTDLLWTFHIPGQLKGFVDHQSTPIFTKSVIVRNVPLVNLGGKKYVNVPAMNSYQVAEVPMGTQNAVYCNGWLCVENKVSKRVEYFIQPSYPTVVAKTKIHLDHLANFAVKGNLIFVPEDGRVDIYDNGNYIMKLDAPVCTVDSKLYNTASGILLLESGILYLLNKKN